MCTAGNEHFLLPHWIALKKNLQMSWVLRNTLHPGYVKQWLKKNLSSHGGAGAPVTSKLSRRSLTKCFVVRFPPKLFHVQFQVIKC